MYIKIPEQTIQVPDQTPYDDTPLKTRLALLEAKVSALGSSAPEPSTPPTATRFYSDTCIWNKKLTNESVHSNSAGFITELQKNLRSANAWINAIPYGVPIYFVTDKDAKVPIYDVDPNHASSPITAEILKGINIPAKLIASAGTDGHACIINLSTGYEHNFWKLQFLNNRWECRSAAIIPNAMQGDGTSQRTMGWNSATASHINLGAGCIRKIELETGVIPHALAFAVSVTTCAKWDKFVYPARSSDGSGAQLNAIPMGTRMRFPSNIPIDTSWTPLTKMLVTAVRDYGMILRDTTKGSGVTFYAEDCTQFGMTGNSDLFLPYLNSKKIWDVVGTIVGDKEFPWSNLKVLA